jgi:epoxyqueuosine reductase QueG
MRATVIIGRALQGTGIELVASCGIDAYDARAPEAFRSSVLFPGARGVVVVGSAGPVLWRRFRARMEAEPKLWDAPHPYDALVAETLSRGDDALRAAGIRFLRFDAAFGAAVRVDFVALAQLVGLGSPGPFQFLIHPEHGAWWALRGAWLVEADIDPPLTVHKPCDGCPAPCIGGLQNASKSAWRATPEVRARCIVGQSSRYDAEQIAYHEDRVGTVLRLRGPHG